MTFPDEKIINEWYNRLKKEADEGGYHLNPDISMTKMLIEGLIINNQRYDYPSCPCRLAIGKKELDIDIICPCDYRDPDLSEYGACYCALYVNDAIASGKEKAQSIPERRPTWKTNPYLPKAGESEKSESKSSYIGKPESKSFKYGTSESRSEEHEHEWGEPIHIKGLAYPVWRCKVCGYLCARESPPEHCPICKVTKDRFERFM
jgi:ferredoxin-thioredoxin reductase catalytic chain